MGHGNQVAFRTKFVSVFFLGGDGMYGYRNGVYGYKALMLMPFLHLKLLSISPLNLFAASNS